MITYEQKTNQLIDVIDPTKQMCLDCREYKDKKLFTKNKFFCDQCPTHPFKIKSKKMSEEEIKQLVKQWSLVRDSVGNSVEDSVRDSVRSSVLVSVRSSVWDSVWNSVLDSVGDSIWDSVRDSVYAYIGSMFPEIKKWKGTNLENPWDPVRKLWKAGYVSSFDGKIWRVHCGKKAEIIYKFNFSIYKGIQMVNFIFLTGFNIPEQRKVMNENNARWLARNLWIRDMNHPNLQAALKQLEDCAKSQKWDIGIVFGKER